MLLGILAALIVVLVVMGAIAITVIWIDSAIEKAKRGADDLES